MLTCHRRDCLSNRENIFSFPFEDKDRDLILPLYIRQKYIIAVA